MGGLVSSAISNSSIRIEIWSKFMGWRSSFIVHFMIVSAVLDEMKTLSGHVWFLVEFVMRVGVPLGRAMVRLYVERRSRRGCTAFRFF